MTSLIFFPTDFITLTDNNGVPLSRRMALFASLLLFPFPLFLLCVFVSLQSRNLSISFHCQAPVFIVSMCGSTRRASGTILCVAQCVDTFCPENMQRHIVTQRRVNQSAHRHPGSGRSELYGVSSCHRICHERTFGSVEASTKKTGANI